MPQKVELDGWGAFQGLMKLELIRWDWERNSDGSRQSDVLGRFRSRWELASNVQSIELSMKESRTTKGYLLGLRVMLAYSALEHLIDHSIARSGEKVSTVKILDQPLADRLRTSLKTEKIEQSETVSDKHIRDKLAAWAAGQDADVLIVARALRHMFAHGSFSPYGLNVTTKESRAALDDLALAVRVEAQQRFLAWLQDVTIRS